MFHYIVNPMPTFPTASHSGRVATPYGEGDVVKYRPAEGIYEVKLPYGIGFIHSKDIKPAQYAGVSSLAPPKYKGVHTPGLIQAGGYMPSVAPPVAPALSMPGPVTMPVPSLGYSQHFSRSQAPSVAGSQQGTPVPMMLPTYPAPQPAAIQTAVVPQQQLNNSQNPNPVVRFSEPTYNPAAASIRPPTVTQYPAPVPVPPQQYAQPAQYAYYPPTAATVAPPAYGYPGYPYGAQYRK
uniref:Uncharacterized protein n=1 Tax=Chromera velia CCMP2878 TaxID=1169474 RepID=A0A0G4F5Q5_9ALVE|mmetsp:Transcript_37404/g.73608  ORF Transcript_37404/g.73608 Transcript_37404/m.73608 type:complete len:237 (+) Transcript_37404:234-944(+)|eukprot:Cvel_15142.t1-p1 / transcript=Cvel_15142.t1 / gene=Cvel_15142 / organism=Chromera_velia_CCMP2878 / gene_product=hypothetical protein / transcript_product=hypothetical protein / location=Cvel_scaffold1105:28344-29165(-) / protein_length=236 / sequence_SO=supercontig / SO=protein_coding / is_pseudo=false